MLSNLARKHRATHFLWWMGFHNNTEFYAFMQSTQNAERNHPELGLNRYLSSGDAVEYGHDA